MQAVLTLLDLQNTLSSMISNTWMEEKQKELIKRPLHIFNFISLIIFYRMSTKRLEKVCFGQSLRRFLSKSFKIEAFRSLYGGMSFIKISCRLFRGHHCKTQCLITCRIWLKLHRYKLTNNMIKTLGQFKINYAYYHVFCVFSLILCHLF